MTAPASGAAWNPRAAERLAQAAWQDSRVAEAPQSAGENARYVLSMFPYPSGALHMGHVRNYSAGDCIARYQRMRGRPVLQPMGWDAGGLPAENAALKRGISPGDWTRDNIAHMRSQIKELGMLVDWSRELETIAPTYYIWEQWLFARMWEMGLVYQAEAPVNWDPVDNTVLANEQVIDGRGWRSGALIERRSIKQWYLRITDYADELLTLLDDLDGQWPPQVIAMQRNWIGRSEGHDVSFALADVSSLPKTLHAPLSIFTTRIDTLFGATYLALSPEHDIAKYLAKKDATVAAFLEKCRQAPTQTAELAKMEKRGVNSGLQVIHPITGEKMPVWIANFVIADYGSGVVMSVPAHDQRDFEFAALYHLPISTVIDSLQAHDYTTAAMTDEGTLVHSGDFSGLSSSEAKTKIGETLAAKGACEARVQFRLRDWLISRQRYWGTPIPVVHCDACGPVLIPDDALPVIRPDSLIPDGQGNALASCHEFVEVVCPTCNAPAKRETDTFDTFINSAWYFSRFTTPHDDTAMVAHSGKGWLPVDTYIGGIEHAILHLLSSRFIYLVMRDLGLVPGSQPFRRLICQGMVRLGGRKMSKSENNIVDPQDMFQRYGVDSVRLGILFAAPLTQSYDWSEKVVVGTDRFLQRLWTTAHAIGPLAAHSLSSNDLSQAASQLRRQMNSCIDSVTKDFESCTSLNTAIAHLMELLNHIPQSKYWANDRSLHAVAHETISSLIAMLQPAAPHVTHVLWNMLGHSGDVVSASWPEAKMVAEETQVKLAIQVNGRMRSVITVARDTSKEDLMTHAMALDGVTRAIGDASIARSIHVPGRILNIVTT